MKTGALSIGDLTRMYAAREVQVGEVIADVFESIERGDSTTHAFLHTQRAKAMDEARRFDDLIERGEALPPLGGIPVAVKDNMNMRGVPTTCGSRILEDYVPPFTATAVERLEQAGAIVVGKTNLDEFAMGSSTENSAYSPTCNPHDPARVPGGSSGGSAAAVAAGWIPVALGSDTGGSIRQPASFCGVVGMKPTYGRVSRYGLVAFASSLDQIGTLSGTVADSAAVLQHIAGPDPYDSTSADRDVEDWVGGLDGSLEGLRIGVPKEYFVDGMDRAVHERVQDAIRVLEGLGCQIQEISLPHTEYAVATYYLIATAEASSNLARYDGVRYGLRVESANLESMYRRTRTGGFGREVQRRILLGTYALSAGYYDAYYLKAQKVRTLILNDFHSAFEKVDVIATATAPSTAFGIGEKTSDPLEMYLSDIFTLPCSLAGLPGMSVPCGTDSAGMPIGMQLIGNHFGEGRLFRVAHRLEQSQTSWGKPQ